MENEFEEQINDRMERASLKDLMPGFDQSAEWSKLQSRLQQGGGKKIQLTWLRAAAALLLLAGGGWLTKIAMTGEQAPAVAAIVSVPTVNTATPPAAFLSKSDEVREPSATIDEGAIEVKKKPGLRSRSLASLKPASGRLASSGKMSAPVDGSGANKSERFFNYYMSNEMVCNGTPCPIEICVVQTFKCQNAKPSAVATCNTLNPDESKPIRFKAQDKKGNDCKVTVDEITIRRVSTGETIVLNAFSRPSTAEQLFECITGKEKCNILAGVFDADCNNHCKPHDLTIYNNEGNLTFQ
jgi:hypothetical protein